MSQVALPADAQIGEGGRGSSSVVVSSRNNDSKLHLARRPALDRRHQDLPRCRRAVARFNAPALQHCCFAYCLRGGSHRNNLNVITRVHSIS